MNIKKRKSQEEMVGFVLIIVLVAVIALVFLSIGVLNKGEIKQDKEIENFLQSSLFYTTSCYKSEEIAYNLKDLIKACFNNEKCLDNRDSCNVLNETLAGLIAKSWKISEESEEKAYILKVYQKDNILINLNEGKETEKENAAKVAIYAARDNIYLEMGIFY